MWDLEYIKNMNKESGKTAKGKKPYIAKCDNDENVLRCPNFGDYRPKKWRLKNKYFVDNSGFGSNNEPALTIDQFLSKVKVGYGYAITEVDQFQVHIGEFEAI